MMREHTSPRAVVSRDTRDRVLTPLANVSRRADLGELATRLAELRDWLASDLSDLEHHLKSIDVQGKREVAWSAANYLLEQRGKCNSTEALLRFPGSSDIVYFIQFLYFLYFPIHFPFMF